VRARLGVPADAPLLLTATRLAAEKKLERAIDALKGLLAFRPDAYLALLGSGGEEERLRQRAREAGCESRVLFPGGIVQAELPDWYRSADVVLSLLDRTNGANPVFEAMACGRPVVVLDTGTTRAVVEDGRTGVVLPPEDLPRLGEILHSLLADPERMARLGSAAAAAIRGKVMDLNARLALEVDLITRAAMGLPLEAKR
jgi:glycosyltransferase involved in cell wall biosynthesis